MVTDAKGWIFEYDPQTKRLTKSSKWHTSSSLQQTKARMNKSRIKTTLIAFFGATGVFCYKVPPGRGVNGSFYKEVNTRTFDEIVQQLDAAPQQQNKGPHAIRFDVISR